MIFSPSFFFTRISSLVLFFPFVLSLIFIFIFIFICIYLHFLLLTWYPHIHSTSKEIAHANGELEKLLNEWENCAEGRAESARIKAERRKKHEAANKAALEHLLTIYTPEALERGTLFLILCACKCECAYLRT